MFSIRRYLIGIRFHIEFYSHTTACRITQENMEAFCKETMPDVDMALVKKAMQTSSMKVTKCGDVLSFEECFGGGLPTKKMSCKLDEQFRYEQKGD